jgi:hypothetical protein
MSRQDIPLELPHVSEVKSLFLDPESVVHLQFQSDDKLYALAFPLDEFLRLEDWLITIRRSVGQSHKKDRR